MKSKTSTLVSLLVLVVLLALSIWQFWPLDQKITQGLDLRGGLSVILSVEPLEGEELTEQTMTRVETILIERVDGFGVSEATVQRQGQSAFLVQLPGVANAEEALSLLGEPGKLEFVDLSSVTDTDTISLIYEQLAAEQSEDTTTAPELDPTKYSAFMTGDVITDAIVTTDEYGNPAVSVSMNSEGTAVWADVTTRLAGREIPIAIILDGRAKSAPTVINPILNGDTMITGSFTVEEANKLAAVLESGSLPVSIAIDESRLVSPTLGQDSLQEGLIAALVGLVLVALFMIAYYRGMGLLSVVSLLIYGVLFLGVLGILSRLGIFALTLPGIAGVVLTIGVAADTSILIFERLKEEIEAGKTHRSAAKSAVRSAILTSIDADIVTLVSAVALYVFAIGPVRGFAFTLILGIVIDLVAALLFTAPLVRLFAEGPMAKVPALFGVKGGASRG